MIAWEIGGLSTTKLNTYDKASRVEDAHNTVLKSGRQFRLEKVTAR